MSNLIHFLNGKFVSGEDLLISPRDLGYVRGYAVADYIVTHNHKPIKLTAHIDRLFKSAEVIGLRFPRSKTQIAAWVQETLEKNEEDTEKTIKIILSGGSSKTMYQTEVPTLVMIVSAYTPQPVSYYEKGVKAKAVLYKRQHPEAKHTHYVEAIRQLGQVQEEGITEIIYYDDTQVFEGAGNSIFAVINNKLVTTKSHIVDGTTRNTLLEILQLPIPIEIRDFTLDELCSATEVFLTGSGSRVKGVVEINGRAVGDGKVGLITKEVSRQYIEYIDSMDTSDV